MFLERSGGKLVITFDRVVGDSLCVKQWRITDNSVGHLLPPHTSHLVHRDEVFDSQFTVPPGSVPLPYYEESVDTSLNSYKKPMAEETYSYFINNMLYSESHYQAKDFWLWDAFHKHAIDGRLREKFPTRGAMLLDFMTVKKKKHPWHTWTHWKSVLFNDDGNRAACELIFMP